MIKIEEIILLLGTVLIFAELFIPGGIAGTIGFLMVIYAMAGLTSSIQALVISLILFILLVGFLIYILIKVIPKDRINNKLILNRELDSESGFNSNVIPNKELEGQRGITITVLKPTGKIKISGEIYYVISDDKYIDKDRQVEVIKVEANKILVREVGK